MPPSAPVSAVTLLRSPVRLASPSPESDADQVRDLLAGDVRVASRFFDRHSPRVERLLGRVLGPTADIGDALNETFCRAFDRLDRLERPEGVSAWLCGIAVMVAREEIRAKKRRGWLQFFSPESVPEAPAPASCDEDRQALARVFELLATLTDDDRIVFALRHLEGFELTEVATSIGVSLASVKRHLARAEKRFFAKCANDPVLAPWAKEIQTEAP